MEKIKTTYSHTLKDNAGTIDLEFDWLSALISQRLHLYFENNERDAEPAIIPPDLEKDYSNYARYIQSNQLSELERLIIASALAMEFKPMLFDKMLIRNENLNKRFTEFGGITDDRTGIFTPTLETIAFIMYGNSLEHRFKIKSIFDDDHLFYRECVVKLDDKGTSYSTLSRTFAIGEEFLNTITLGKKYRPNYSSNFPANRITTPMDWNELVLGMNTLDEIENINAWLEYQEEITTDPLLGKQLNKGYKSLFYGPPGTGKTLTATMLGKKNDRDVYRIDLSQLVSKYIGETEKNLANVFDLAENKSWILFFDEAESLFSKRTQVADAHDKYANQQTAYLLQRMEDYSGLIILATNLKPNIDVAFTRRLQSVINFPIPGSELRRELWLIASEGICELEDAFLEEVSEKYELSGGLIRNIVQYSWLVAKKNKRAISEQDIIKGIRRELTKEGKSFIM